MAYIIIAILWKYYKSCGQRVLQNLCPYHHLLFEYLVCRGSAEDYIKENKTNIGTSIAKALEISFTQSMNTGYSPQSPFQDFYRGLLNPYGQSFTSYAGLNDFEKLKPLSGASSPLRTQYELLPGDEPRKGGLKKETVGTAVFDGDRMVGVLSSYETRYFLMVIGRFQRGVFTFEDKNAPGKVIPFDLRPGRRPEIKVTFENGAPVIDVNVNIEADIGAIQSRLPYESTDKLEGLNNMLKEKIGEGIKNVIEKTQREWNCDIFKFGYHAAGHFFTIQEFTEYDWLKHYKDAKVNVEVHANIRRTGLMAESVPIMYSNDDASSEEDK